MTSSKINISLLVYFILLTKIASLLLCNTAAHCYFLLQGRKTSYACHRSSCRTRVKRLQAGPFTLRCLVGRYMVYEAARLRCLVGRYMVYEAARRPACTMAVTGPLFKKVDRGNTARQLRNPTSCFIILTQLFQEIHMSIV